MADAKAPSRFPIVYAAAFALAAILAIIMLVTDTNLQTNFGTAPKYFVHWYGVLGMAVADLIAVALLLAWRTRAAVVLGVVGSSLLSLAMVAVVATYQQVGFASAGDFANYLFGVTYFGGDVRYLYDALLGVDVATAVGGAVYLAATRRSSHSAPTDERSQPSST